MSKLYISTQNKRRIAAAAAWAASQIGGRVKKSQSHTKTLTQKKTEMNNEDTPQGVNQTYVKVSTGLPPLKRVIKGTITYRDEFFHNQDTTGNLTNFACPWYIGTASQWLVGTDNAVATNRDGISYASWHSLNPYAGLAASSIVTANQAPANDWMGCSYATVYMDFINRSTTPCFIKLHYFVAKQDSDETVLAAYNEAKAGGVYSTNYVFGAAGAVATTSGNEEVFQYASPSTTLREGLATIAYTNLMSKRIVKSTWRKVKTKTLVMAAADTHRVTTNIRMNQFSIKERTFAASVTFPKGTMCCIIEVQATAAVITSNNEPIIGTTNISVVTTRKIQLCPLKSPNGRIDSTYMGAGTVRTGTLAAATEQLSAAITSQATQTT